MSAPLIQMFDSSLIQVPLLNLLGAFWQSWTPCMVETFIIPLYSPAWVGRCHQFVYLVGLRMFNEPGAKPLFYILHLPLSLSHVFPLLPLSIVSTKTDLYLVYSRELAHSERFLTSCTWIPDAFLGLWQIPVDDEIPWQDYGNSIKNRWVYMLLSRRLSLQHPMFDIYQECTYTVPIISPFWHCPVHSCHPKYQYYFSFISNRRIPDRIQWSLHPTSPKQYHTVGH